MGMSVCSHWAEFQQITASPTKAPVLSQLPPVRCVFMYRALIFIPCFGSAVTHASDFNCSPHLNINRDGPAKATGANALIAMVLPMQHPHSQQLTMTIIWAVIWVATLILPHWQLFASV